MPSYFHPSHKRMKICWCGVHSCVSSVVLWISEKLLQCVSLLIGGDSLRVMLQSFHGVESAAHVTLTSIHHNEATMRSLSTQLEGTANISWLIFLPFNLYLQLHLRLSLVCLSLLSFYFLQIKFFSVGLLSVISSVKFTNWATRTDLVWNTVCVTKHGRFPFFSFY